LGPKAYCYHISKLYRVLYLNIGYVCEPYWLYPSEFSKKTSELQQKLKPFGIYRENACFGK
jgi:hypothetical protein